LTALLALERDIEVVAEVGRGGEVVPAARASRPDVCVLDIEMPGADGIEATAAVRRALPGCRVLVVTTFGRPGYLKRALAAGATGFVVKDTPARDRKSTRLNSSHVKISYAVFCLKKKNKDIHLMRI